MEKTESQHQVHLDSAIHLLAGDLSETADRSGLDLSLARGLAGGFALRLSGIDLGIPDRQVEEDRLKHGRP